MSEKGESSCAICNKIEPVTDETYEVCFECGHVYETEQDLIDTEYETAQSYEDQAIPKQKGIDILYCPLCLHDFL